MKYVATLTFAIVALLASAACAQAQTTCARIQTLLQGSGQAPGVNADASVQGANLGDLQKTLSSLESDESAARKELAAASAEGDQNLASIEREVISDLDRSIRQTKQSISDASSSASAAKQQQHMLQNQSTAQGCSGSTQASTAAAGAGAASSDFSGRWVVKTTGNMWGKPQTSYHNAQLVGPPTGPWTVDETLVATTSLEFQSSVGAHDTNCIVSLQPNGAPAFSCRTVHAWATCVLSSQSDGSFSGPCQNGSIVELRRGSYSAP